MRTLARWFDLPVGSERNTWRRYWKESLLAYLFLLPPILVLGFFSFYPVIRAGIISLFDWGLGDDHPFLGLANYKELLHDPDFWSAVGHTFYYAAIVVPVSIALALGIALLLNRKIALLPLYRLSYFIPYVTSSVAVSMVWSWIFNDRWGLLNYVIQFFGGHPQNWLSSPKWAMPVVMVIAIWKIVGYDAVLFLAGLQNIDKELYQAARVDGAEGGTLFRYITWPLLSPMTFFVSIMAVIGSFKVFTEIYVLFGATPGPMDSASTMVFYIYNKAFHDFRLGYASAAGYVLFFIILLFTLLQMGLSRNRVHYD